MILVSVYDKLSGQYSPPQVEHNQETAIRMFKKLCKDSQIISQSLDDYALYVVGEFDFEDGIVFDSKQVTSLLSGTTCSITPIKLIDSSAFSPPVEQKK